MAYKVVEENNLFLDSTEAKLQVAYELAGERDWLIKKSIKKHKEYLLNYIHKKPREIAEIILNNKLTVKGE